MSLKSVCVLGVTALVAGAGSATASVTLQPDEAASKDTFNYEFLPTFNFETSGPGFQSVLAATETASGHRVHSQVEFDLSGVTIAPASVSAATLSLYAVDGNAVFGNFANPAPGSSINLEVLAVGGSWVESTVTWLTEPAPTGAIVDTVNLDGINQWITFDVTGLVQNWLAGSLTNNGFLLEQAAEVVGPGGLVAGVFDSSSGGNRPRLTIVPEPSALGLLAVGGLMSIALRRRSR